MCTRTSESKKERKRERERERERDFDAEVDRRLRGDDVRDRDEQKNESVPTIHSTIHEYMKKKNPPCHIVDINCNPRLLLFTI